MTKIVHPSIAETAFTCPHCHALTTQQRFSATASRLDDGRTPAVWTLNSIEKVDALKKKSADAEERDRVAEFEAIMRRAVTGFGFSVGRRTPTTCIGTHTIFQFKSASTAARTPSGFMIG